MPGVLKKGKFNQLFLNKLLKGINLKEHLLKKKKKQFNIILRGASLRFLLTRLYDFMHKKKNSIVTLKDPVEYYSILTFHIQSQKGLIISNKFVIYTDGACIGNPGKGGWGAIIFDDSSKKIVLSGSEEYTTNNKMELTATIKALKYLKHKSNITIFTDSKYVIDGINNWILKWKHNNWKTANKKEVKNKELWLDLYKCISFHSVDWKWVKGHSGDPFNEEVDKIAREEAEKIISS